MPIFWYDGGMDEKPGRRAPPYPLDRETLERECEVEYFIASGPGGQHRNKTESGVRLTHHPSGLVLTATERRSQHQNLDKAYERLTERLAKLNEVQKKRVPTRLSRRKREIRKRDKALHGQVKQARRRPGAEE